MGKFFSIPGVSLGKSSGSVPRELLEQRYPNFYKNRPERPQNFAAPGDRYKFNGDEAQVLHQEKNSDGSIDVTIQRSAQGNSGTYVARVVPDGNRLTVSDTKRTFD